MDDLRDRLANRIELTSDGHHSYLEAVEGAFGGDVDYAQIVKIYGAGPDTVKGRYSPAERIGAQKHRIEGSPDPAHISTSYAERQNLSMRMHMRRFTRSPTHSARNSRTTSTWSRYTVFYNWTRVHKTLRVTPAMEAALTDRLWTMEEIAEMIDATLPKPGRPATYKKRQPPAL